jgi:dihydroorotase
MSLLLKNARIIDPSSPHNGSNADVLIESGVIRSIKTGIRIEKGIKTIESPNLHVSPGWFDMQANFRDPGFEYKEDLASGMSAAAAGGFTGVAVMPSTNPPVHTKAEVEYIINKTQYISSPVQVFPVGCISHKHEGKEMAEMYDMHLSGAVAFSDDKKPLTNAGLLLRALLYSKNFNGLVIAHCDDSSISQDGKMNEGIMNTKLGLKGIPALAEELMIARNIYIAEYSDCRIHFSSVSTARSVELIRDAKARGLEVTASVSAHHLAVDETALAEFDTNYKVTPPLRTKADIDALRKGVADGTIDVIVSDHTPEDVENKVVEFDHAAFGMLGLETAYSLVNTYKGKIRTEVLVNKLAVRPREILNLPIPSITEGEKANITFFDPEVEWTFTDKDIRSKSRNTPFIGSRFKGKVLGVYNRKQSLINK